MSKLEVLELIQELFREAVIMKTSPDDPSGISTTFIVDQERLMYNIEQEISNEVLRNSED